MSLPLAPWQEDLNVGAGARVALATLRGLKNVGFDPLEFSVDNVLRSARRVARLDDFGDQRFLEPLDLRTRFYREFDDFGSAGRLTVFAGMVGPLINRLRVIDHLKRNPRIRSLPVHKPIFIAGLPRTGTTLLYNLLAQDSRARSLLCWETMRPTPHPRHRPGALDPRIKRARKAIERLNRATPAFRKVHPIDPDGPEECLGLLAIAQIIPLQDHRDQTYREWSDSAPLAFYEAGYREYKEQLQILQAQRHSDYWLLKCPMHMYAMPALLSTFPDATIIQTHRDPAKTLPSMASLVAVMHRIIYNHIDMPGIGAGVIDRTRLLLERATQARDAAPNAFIDVHYRDLVDEPLAAVQAIYDQLGLELDDRLRDKMHSFLRANPRGKHGRHLYSAKDFGLDDQHIRTSFDEYIDHFDISDER